ncbi:dolichol kinase [Theileria orientalis]|uniref:dolichol kinase n=1 Tax=Theileria orientalis TaxID=68886 RepID=A0A976MCF4_THEOR|nr:dolichol kinase [Theileria orientalis]
MCRASFELFLVRFLLIWFSKLYQSKYILKQFMFVLINIAIYGAFNRGEIKLKRLSILSLVQCLLFPLSLASIDNFMLQNFIPLLLIATFQCFWIRLNLRKFLSYVFVMLTLFTVLRLFFSLPGYGLFFIILSQCVLYLFIQLSQKRHIFSIYVFFSQAIVFLVSIVLPKYNSILDFRRFHVFTRNVVYSDNIDKLFINIFYHAVFFLLGSFVTLYLISMYQGERFRAVNAVACLVMFIHFVYKLLHFMFLDKDNGVSNFNILVTFLLEYNTVVFIFLCLVTTIVIFTAIGLNVKYSTDPRSRNTTRKWFHLLIFLFCLYAFYLKLEAFLALVLALVIAFFVFMELFRINKLMFKPMERFLGDLYTCIGHDSEVDKFEISTITMLLGILTPILFELGSEEFDWTRGGLGVFTTGIGDSMASVVGVKYRGNDQNGKSVQGMIAFFLSCLGMMVMTSMLQHGFVDNFRKMFFVSFFSSVYEYVSKEEDNVAVPLLAMLLYKL